MNLHVITGQTATGKTNRALTKAVEHNTDIISCDARQIYTHLSCITGKDMPPSASFTHVTKRDPITIGYYTLDGVRVWGLDIVEPRTSFSSSLYVDYVESVYDMITINKISAPIVVGGTYLYLQDLLYGSTVEVPANPTLRDTLKHATVDDLQKTLIALNPRALEELNHSDAHNPRRLMRKIEIETYATHPSNTQSRKTRILPTVLSCTGYRHASPELLEQRITQRVHTRLQDDALAEIKNLIRLGYNETDPGCSATGCKHLFAHERGEITLEEATHLWIRDEIRYAKRQWTFMKRNPQIDWIEV